MSFILDPVGILLGSHPAVLAGAILSGAGFGDNIAPVSDTTIIAAASQEYKYKEGSADIGGTVRARFRYVFAAGLIAMVLFFLATVFGILIAAINTIANICAAPFINAIGKNNDLHPYRRANILAATLCSFPFFLPYGGCVLLLIGGLSSIRDVYAFLPVLSAKDMLFTSFYNWAIWIIMLISCITGIGRCFEGKDRSVIAAKKNPYREGKK